MTTSERIVRCSPYVEAVARLSQETIRTRHDLERMYEYAAELKKHAALLVLADSASLPGVAIARAFHCYATAFGDEAIFNRLVELLHRHRLLFLLPDIIERVAVRSAQYLHIGVYTCYSVEHLDDDARSRIDMRVRSFGGYADTVPLYRQDHSLIAGFFLKGHDGWSADYSIRGSLAALTRHLTDEGLL